MKIPFLPKRKKEEGGSAPKKKYKPAPINPDAERIKRANNYIQRVNRAGSRASTRNSRIDLIGRRSRGR